MAAQMSTSSAFHAESHSHPASKPTRKVTDFTEKENRPHGATGKFKNGFTLCVIAHNRTMREMTLIVRQGRINILARTVARPPLIQQEGRYLIPK
jgi:hypothetical protein